MSEKSKKKRTISISCKKDSTSLKISVLDSGDCTFEMTGENSNLSIQLPEEFANQIRLLFWDNYRRRHIWKTKAQKKSERQKQVMQLPPLDSYENYEIPDIISMGESDNLLKDYFKDLDSIQMTNM